MIRDDDAVPVWYNSAPAGDNPGPVWVAKQTLPTTSAEVAKLRLDNWALRKQNEELREMIPLLRSRIDAFLLWFDATVNSIH